MRRKTGFIRASRGWVLGDGDGRAGITLLLLQNVYLYTQTRDTRVNYLLYITDSTSGGYRRIMNMTITRYLQN
jgi:hypothetical protein